MEYRGTPHLPKNAASMGHPNSIFAGEKSGLQPSVALAKVCHSG